jgi:hypothetical protein
VRSDEVMCRVPCAIPVRQCSCIDGKSVQTGGGGDGGGVTAVLSDFCETDGEMEH